MRNPRGGGGASFGKPCASSYVEGILDEYIHSIVRMYIHVYNYFRVVGKLVRSSFSFYVLRNAIIHECV